MAGKKKRKAKRVQGRRGASRRTSSTKRRGKRRAPRRVGCKVVTKRFYRKVRGGKRKLVTFKAHVGPNCPKRRKPRLHGGMSVWKKAAKFCGHKRGAGRVGKPKFTSCMKQYVKQHGG